MNPNEVRGRLEKIREDHRLARLKGEWCGAQSHMAVDQLREDLLRSIAQGECEDPALCAAEALKTEDFDSSWVYE